MKKKGITLMEVIIVMAIIALGALLIVPNIGAWIPNYRPRSTTRDIVSSLRTAQMKAVATKHRQVLKTTEIPNPCHLELALTAVPSKGGMWCSIPTQQPRQDTL